MPRTVYSPRGIFVNSEPKSAEPVMDTTPPSNKQSALYGQACKDCARAKSRCIIRARNEPCDRCRRLNKTCVPRERIRTRNGKTMESLRAAQASQLVSKIDGLVSLLTLASDPSATTGLPNSAGLDPNSSNGNRISNLDSLVEAATRRIPAGSSSPPRYSYSTKSPSSSPLHSGSSPHVTSHSSLASRTVITSAPELSPANIAISPAFSGFQPSECLELFRTQLLTYFPFIDIQSCKSAQELRQEKPLLFRVIMAIVSPATSQKLALGTEIKETLATRILVNNEDSVDILLATLAFVTWGHDQFLTPLNLSRFTQLAMSLVFDLRLNKPLPSDMYMISAIDAGSSNPLPQPPSTRNLDERRAVLACFLLSSNVSLYFGKIDALRWTAYMDECLLVLISNKACSGDAVLVIQVRLQLLIDIVARTTGDVSYGGQSSEHGGPPLLYLKALHADLDGIKRSIPPELQDNKLLLAHIFNTELSINEMGIPKSPSVSSLNFQRLETLYACLNSIKSWFDNFFEFPLCAYIGISFPFFAQLGHCVAALYRLYTLEDPGWDKTLLRQTADFLQILDRIIDNIKRVKDLDNQHHKGEMFTRTIQIFESIRIRCGIKLGENGNLSSIGEDALGDPLEDSAFMDVSGDAWLRDMLGSWDYGFQPSVQLS